MSTEPTPTATTWRAALCGVVLFAAVDLLVFRSWLWAWIANPNSSSGWVARRCLIEPVLDPEPTPPALLLLGDSRMTEACSAHGLQALLRDLSVTVRDKAIPGSTPRVWPWLFAAQRVQVALLVVGLGSYDDIDSEPFAERRLDLSFLGPLLSPADGIEVASSYPPGNGRRDAWLCSWCKLYAWRRDVQDFLAAPWQRYRDVRMQLGRWSWARPYEGVEGDLRGVHVEGDQIVGLPEGKAHLAAPLRELVAPPRPAPGNPEYRRRWLGRLCEIAAARGTHVAFLRLPTQVLPRAVPPPRNQGVLDELAGRPMVHVLDADLFAELERPEFFYDTLHVNRAGRERFTAALAAALRAQFGPLFRK